MQVVNFIMCLLEMAIETKPRNVDCMHGWDSKKKIDVTNFSGKWVKEGHDRIKREKEKGTSTG